MPSKRKTRSSSSSSTNAGTWCEPLAIHTGWMHNISAANISSWFNPVDCVKVAASAMEIPIVLPSKQQLQQLVHHCSSATIPSLDNSDASAVGVAVAWMTPDTNKNYSSSSSPVNTTVVPNNNQHHQSQQENVNSSVSASNNTNNSVPLAHPFDPATAINKVRDGDNDDDDDDPQQQQLRRSNAINHYSTPDAVLLEYFYPRENDNENTNQANDNRDVHAKNLDDDSTRQQRKKDLKRILELGTAHFESLLKDSDLADDRHMRRLMELLVSPGVFLFDHDVPRWNPNAHPPAAAAATSNNTSSSSRQLQPSSTTDHDIIVSGAGQAYNPSTHTSPYQSPQPPQPPKQPFKWNWSVLKIAQHHFLASFITLTTYEEYLSLGFSIHLDCDSYATALRQARWMLACGAVRLLVPAPDKESLMHRVHAEFVDEIEKEKWRNLDKQRWQHFLGAVAKYTLPKRDRYREATERYFCVLECERKVLLDHQQQHEQQEQQQQQQNSQDSFVTLTSSAPAGRCGGDGGGSATDGCSNNNNDNNNNNNQNDSSLPLAATSNLSDTSSSDHHQHHVDPNAGVSSPTTTTITTSITTTAIPPQQQQQQERQQQQSTSTSNVNKMNKKSEISSSVIPSDFKIPRIIPTVFHPAATSATSASSPFSSSASSYRTPFPPAKYLLAYRATIEDVLVRGYAVQVCVDAAKPHLDFLWKGWRNFFFATLFSLLPGVEEDAPLCVCHSTLCEGLVPGMLITAVPKTKKGMWEDTLHVRRFHHMDARGGGGGSSSGGGNGGIGGFSGAGGGDGASDQSIFTRPVVQSRSKDDKDQDSDVVNMLFTSLTPLLQIQQLQQQHYVQQQKELTRKLQQQLQQQQQKITSVTSPSNINDTNTNNNKNNNNNNNKSNIFLFAQQHPVVTSGSFSRQFSPSAATTTTGDSVVANASSPITTAASTSNDVTHSQEGSLWVEPSHQMCELITNWRNYVLRQVSDIEFRLSRLFFCSSKLVSQQQLQHQYHHHHHQQQQVQQQNEQPSFFRCTCDRCLEDSELVLKCDPFVSRLLPPTAKQLQRLFKKFIYPVSMNSGVAGGSSATSSGNGMAVATQGSHYFSGVGGGAGVYYGGGSSAIASRGAHSLI